MKRKMKTYKIILGIVACLFTVTSCVDTKDMPIPVLPDIEEGKQVTLSFSSAFFNEGTTKSITNVTDLQLLVFDENNQFITRTEAILEGVIQHGGVDVRTFKVTLLSSAKPRYIHFIAGYDWTGFKTTHELLYTNEGEIIPSMVSSGNRCVYWTRIALDGTTPFGMGINTNSFQNKIVHLLRNQAKISLLISNAVSTFTLDRYTIYNRPSHGTIATFKYNPTTFSYSFAEEQLTVAPQAIPGPTPVYPTDYISSDDGITLYEWNNNLGNTRVFAIFRGTYREDLGNGNFGPPQANRYYKLDLVDSDNAGEVYDVYRNIHYRFIVETIEFEGYPTAAAAAAAPASNNVFASLELQDYPSISDGTSSLQVLKLEEIITQPLTNFQTNILYIPNLSSPTLTNPGAITITPVQPFDASNWTWNYTPNQPSTGVGLFSATPNVIPTEEVVTAEFKVSVTGSSMMRLIRLTLRQPYALNATFPDNGGNKSLGDPFRIQFTVPGTIPENLFPIPVYITTKYLSPDARAGYDNKMLVISENPYKFMYEIKANEVGTTVTLNFKINKDPGSETIAIVSNPYFISVNQPISWN